jgi:hypothetical protein
MKVSSEKWNEFCSIEEIYEWLGCEQITTESTNTESITIETTTTEIIRNESTTKETLKSYTIFWIIITIIVITIILMNAIVVFLVLYFRNHSSESDSIDLSAENFSEAPNSQFPNHTQNLEKSLFKELIRYSLVKYNFISANN